MSDELKPCAHCGSAAELMCPSGLSWWVQCTNKSCGMATKIAYSDEPVISAWNNRAAPVPPSQEARDAERYRWLVRKVCMVQSASYGCRFELINLPVFFGECQQDAAAAFTARIDEAMQDDAYDAAILAAKEKK